MGEWIRILTKEAMSKMSSSTGSEQSMVNLLVLIALDFLAFYGKSSVMSVIGTRLDNQYDRAFRDMSTIGTRIGQPM